MIVFKEELLGRIRTLLTALPAAAQADVMENDIGMIERQLERYRRRLEYWYERQWILEGLQIDDETRTITFRDKSVTFSKREYQLLIMLVGRSPIFVTAKQLLVQAWHDSRLPEETLRTYIGRVRTKLLSLGLEAEIQNRPRRGYALIFQDKPRGGSERPELVR
jgi:DNA-binding response OmpR family regulator